MTAGNDDKTGCRQPPAGRPADALAKRPTAKQARAARLAVQLRANLKRRKASQRDREVAAPGDGGLVGPEGAAKMPPDETC